MMTAYILVSVWVVSAALCHYIAKLRGVKLSVWWDMLTVVFGPFTIPFVYLLKPQSRR